jgi:hypothetical protein
MKPNFRCGTKRAIEELALELNLPYDSTMQDWSYEVSNPNDLYKYISHYSTINDDDKKFVLMEMILQALNDQFNEQQLLSGWEMVKPILVSDFNVHEYTISHWKDLIEENFDNCKVLSQLLKELWETRLLDSLNT